MTSRHSNKDSNTDFSSLVGGRTNHYILFFFFYLSSIIMVKTATVRQCLARAFVPTPPVIAITWADKAGLLLWRHVFRRALHIAWSHALIKYRRPVFTTCFSIAQWRRHRNSQVWNPSHKSPPFCARLQKYTSTSSMLPVKLSSLNNSQIALAAVQKFNRRDFLTFSVFLFSLHVTP